MKKNKSQIAVIITFVIIVIILFVTVFINIAKVCQVKTITSQAADRVALAMASQLGSMSAQYKKILEAEAGLGFTAHETTTATGEKVWESCSINWKTIIIFIIAIVSLIVAISFPPALLVGALAVYAINQVMAGSINQQFKGMSDYNALRESTLFQALASMQTDDVQLKATSPGVFCEDGGRCYDLAAIGMPEMLRPTKVDRFSAWYAYNRLQYMVDKKLAAEIDSFVYGDGTIGSRNGLIKYVSVDTTKPPPWGEIEKISYVLVPGTSADTDLCVEGLLPGNLKYDVTCDNSTPCPTWVKDPVTDEIWIARVDALEGIYDGFIEDKFKSLLSRLEASFGNIYCAACPIRPADVDSLKTDVGMLLMRIRELVNMAATQRLNNVTQWIKAFYDFEKHKPGTRYSSTDTFSNPCLDFAADRDKFNEDYSYDIYLRLWRDRTYIQSWVKKLEEIDVQIKTVVVSAHGECTWGRGPSVDSTCYTQYGCSTAECGCHCCGSDCSGCCCNTCCYPSSIKNPCAWEGTYYTCAKSPVVCSAGDLYLSIPTWCSSIGDHSGCHSNCGCSVDNFNNDDPEKNFQGQLAWDNILGPTEVGQAVMILRALQKDFHLLQLLITRMSDIVERLLASSTAVGSNGELLRNEIAYAWKDKNNFSHLVYAKIDGYPKELPNLTENITWWYILPLKCRQLHEYTGNFTITTARYDQDQPTTIADWKLRRRKGVDTPEFDVGSLKAVVADIQDNAIINNENNEQAAVNTILNSYAIKSSAQACYGPEKENIYIMKTEGD